MAGSVSDPVARKYMNVKEASDYLQIHVMTLYRHAKNGVVPFSKVGSQYRFDKTRLDAWMEHGAASWVSK